MKRALPFLIILAVAAITAGAGAWLYRAKMQSASLAPVAVEKNAIAPPAAPPEVRHVRGLMDAPVNLEIFGDFQCPPCRDTSALIDDLQKQQEANLRVTFWEFPLAMHEHARPAAMAAEAASKQGRFWQMHDLLYRHQDDWAKSAEFAQLFREYAQRLGMDVARFEADAQSDAIKMLIVRDEEQGMARGVRSTPTIFVNGELVKSPHTREKLQAAITSALRTKGN